MLGVMRRRRLDGSSAGTIGEEEVGWILYRYHWGGGGWMDPLQVPLGSLI